MLFSVLSYSQELELKELSSPSNPAFNILGLTPTNINRITLPKPFVMSLANSFDGKSIASDVAVETTPYWWISHPDLTFKNFYGMNGKSDLSNILEQIARSFSFSFATIDASPDVDSIDSRNLAAGIRFQILDGKPSREFIEAYSKTLQLDLTLKKNAVSHLRRTKLDSTKSYPELIDAINSSVDEIVKTNVAFTKIPDEIKEKFKSIIFGYIVDYTIKLKDMTYNKDSTNNFFKKFEESLVGQINETLIKMHGISRVGWLLEFSCAASLLAPTNKIDYTIGQDFAGWGTLTYRLDSKEGSKNKNDFNLMFRFGGDFQSSNEYNRDFGLSWVLGGEDYGLSLESIFRNYVSHKYITATDGNIYKISESNNTWHFSLAFQYRISDTINLSLTAGKDFENSKIYAGGLFSLLNFNLVIPSKQLIKIDK